MAKKPKAEKLEAKKPKRKKMPENQKGWGKKIVKGVVKGIVVGTVLWFIGGIAAAFIVGLPANTPLAAFGIGFAAEVANELAEIMD